MADRHDEATAQSENSLDGSLAKDAGADDAAKTHIENIRTVSRVPGNPNYYEKDGLRTYGDDEDHDHEPPVSGNALPHWIT